MFGAPIGWGGPPGTGGGIAVCGPGMGMPGGGTIMPGIIPGGGNGIPGGSAILGGRGIPGIFGGAFACFDFSACFTEIELQNSYLHFFFLILTINLTNNKFHLNNSRKKGMQLDDETN